MTLRNGLGCYGRSVDAENVRPSVLGRNEVNAVNAYYSVVTSVTRYRMSVIYNEQLLAIRRTNIQSPAPSTYSV